MIINITPDKERAKSILKIVENRKNAIEILKKTNFPAMIVENYYDIIKELQTAILLIEGKKTIGESAHKELIKEISLLKIISGQETSLIDDLRMRRNGSHYYGKQIPKVYLEINEQKLKEIITKLELTINKKLLK